MDILGLLKTFIQSKNKIKLIKNITKNIINDMKSIPSKAKKEFISNKWCIAIAIAHIVIAIKENRDNYRNLPYNTERHNNLKETNRNFNTSSKIPEISPSYSFYRRKFT